MDDKKLPTGSEVSASRTKAALGRPALHLIVAASMLVAFLLPLLETSSPVRTVTWMYVAWAAAIVLSFVLSRGRESTTDEER